MKCKFSPVKLLIYFSVAAVALFCILPLWDLVMRSITPQKELLLAPGLDRMADPILLWPKGRATLEGYLSLFREGGYGKHYLQSLGVALLKTAVAMVVTVCGAYVTSRPGLLWKRTILWFCCLPLVFPLEFTTKAIELLVAAYRSKMLVSFGRVVIYPPKSFPSVALAASLLPWSVSAVWMLLLRAAFRSLPRGVEEAALIEGAGPLRQLFRILLPLVRPYLAAVVLLSFTEYWQEFLWSYTLRRLGGLASIYFYNDGPPLYLGGPNPNYAAYVLSILPPFLVMLILHRQLTGDAPKGIVVGTLRDDIRPNGPRFRPEDWVKRQKKPLTLGRVWKLALPVAAAGGLLLYLALPTLRGDYKSTVTPSTGLDTYWEHRAVTAKPILYLYPEETTEVTVTLGHPERLTVTYPAYEEGWTVTAEPDGTLHGLDRDYYALYWEGTNALPFDRTKGFCIEGKDSAAFLEEKLAILGLNDREAEEFIVYWLPQMQQSPYVLVRFRSRAEIEADMPLTVTPAPDSIIRVQMELTLLDAPVEAEPQTLVTPERTGFVVVEWGVVTMDAPSVNQSSGTRYALCPAG